MACCSPRRVQSVPFILCSCADMASPLSTEFDGKLVILLCRERLAKRGTVKSMAMWHWYVTLLFHCRCPVAALLPEGELGSARFIVEAPHRLTALTELSVLTRDSNFPYTCCSPNPHPVLTLIVIVARSLAITFFLTLNLT